jgi:FlaA1/EpsC-like NDP-sugar epimerase
LARPWLEHPILVTATLVPASVETITDIFDSWDANSAQGLVWIVCLLFAVLIAALGFYFSCIRYALSSLALVTLAACAVLTCLTVRVVNLDRPNTGAWSLLMCGAIVLAVFGAGVFFLRSQRLAHQPTS